MKKFETWESARTAFERENSVPMNNHTYERVWENLEETFHCPGVVVGRDILDVGGGRSDDKLDLEGGHYPPYAGRILNFIGANVTVLDIGSNEGEKFQWIQGDIRAGILSRLRENSFDVVINNKCLQMVSQTEFDNGGTSPDFSRDPLEELWATYQNLHREVERVLKPDGIYWEHGKMYKIQN